MYFDLHSHILPSIDDGSKNIEESVQLLEMMKLDGIESVIATSHFYPAEMNLEDYIEQTSSAFKLLCETAKGKELPNLYLGCELLFYSGIGNIENSETLCLNRSKYLLLELTDFDLGLSCFEDILALKEKGIIPIIAHIERYFKGKNYKQLLDFVEDNNIPVQLNAASVMTRPYRRIVKKILSRDIFCVLATDTHSVNERPPLLTAAYSFIETKFGEDLKNRLQANAKVLKKEIIG